MDTRTNLGWHLSLRRFLESDEGTSTVEYAVLLGLIAVTLIPVVQGLGQTINGVNESISRSLGGASEPASPESPLPPGNPINSAVISANSEAWAEGEH